jgi:hypothetical protein
MAGIKGDITVAIFQRPGAGQTKGTKKICNVRILAELGRSLDCWRFQQNQFSRLRNLRLHAQR